MEQPDFKKIAAQLRNPQGEDGLETARRMEGNNAFMIATTIDRLGIGTGEQVLEIGFGGGGHVGYLQQKAQEVHYQGVDISADMAALAATVNELAVANGTAAFHRVEPQNGFVTIPFPDASFDRIFTVNTLYFWDNAAAQARELFRVLKPGGLFLCTFATEAFMKSLPFTAYDFHLYSVAEAAQLMEEAGFIIQDITEEKEMVSTVAGEMERVFVVLGITK